MRGIDIDDEGNRERLIEAWYKHAGAMQSEADFWASEVVQDLVEDDLTRGWSILLELLHRAPTDDVAAYVAAGPLEDYLVTHGPAAIDRVERVAADDAVLRRALSRVWLGPTDLDPSTLRRYRALGVTWPGHRSD